MNALTDYINERRNMPFEWGPNDCVSFSNEALHRLTGKGFADEWIGKYKTAIGAARVFARGKKDNGYSGIIDAIDAKLERDSFPSRGSIVAREMPEEFLGYRIGVCIGEQVAFLGELELVFEPVSHNDITWGISECHQ